MNVSQMNNAIHLPGACFIEDFSIVIHIWWKICLAVVLFVVIRSLQNFAHAMTAVLSWHVQNFVAITLLVFEWNQNEIFIKFELKHKNSSVKWTPDWHWHPASWVVISYPREWYPNELIVGILVSGAHQYAVCGEAGMLVGCWWGQGMSWWRGYWGDLRCGNGQDHKMIDPFILGNIS